MLIKANEKGSTMLETLAVICIIGVVSISGMKLIGSMFSMFKQYAVEGEIKDIYKGVRNRFSASANYNDLGDMTAEEMVVEKMVPSQMFVSNVSGGKSFFHRLGGEVVIDPVCSRDSEEDKSCEFFQVEFKGLTFRSCLSLAQLNWSNGGTSDLLAFSIYQDEAGDSGITFVLPKIKQYLKDFNGEEFPITTAKIIDKFKDADTSKNNFNVMWLFQ